MFRHFMFQGREGRGEEGCRPGYRGGGHHGEQHFGRGGEERGRHSGFGGFGGRERMHGMGGGRERLFDQGELRLVILQLLAEKPSYGYELIKAIEERLAGGYAPSPGVVYPTLTMLEEEGFATMEVSDAGKKVYTVTDGGREHLKANGRRVEEIRERLEHAGRGFERGRSPQIMRAFMNLRGAVQARARREGMSAELIKKMAEAIDGAAKAIDEL